MLVSLALALALAPVGGCAKSSTMASDREALAAAIGGRHFDPDDPPAVARAEGSSEALLSLARDPGEHPRYVAERATSLLRYHPEPAVYAGLRELATDPRGGVREAALVSLGRGFTRAHAGELIELGEAHLDDEDPGVRRAARELVARARASRFKAD